MLHSSPIDWLDRAMSHKIALDPLIADALSNDPIIVYSLSGGKDSSAAAMATSAFLDAIGHPRTSRFAIHADLGLIEWPSTPTFVSHVAELLKTPLNVVQNSTQGLLPRWRQRFDNAKRRYRDLETYALIGPFSSASLRFCTSDTKVSPIGSFLAKAHRGRTIISTVGIRREESATRAIAPVSRLDTRFASVNNRWGTKMITWHPIIEWSEAEVFEHHTAEDFPLHEAYNTYGLTRLSCAYCVLASTRDLSRSLASRQNEQSLREILSLEISSTFSFQPTRWLADLAKSRLSSTEIKHLEQSKERAAERRAMEAQLPSDLRFTRGWPPRVPDNSEAVQICDARARILEHHDLPNLFPTPAMVIDRFAALHRSRRVAA